MVTSFPLTFAHWIVALRTNFWEAESVFDEYHFKNASIKNLSLIMRRHNCRWRRLEFGFTRHFWHLSTGWYSLCHTCIDLGLAVVVSSTGPTVILLLFTTSKRKYYLNNLTSKQGVISLGWSWWMSSSCRYFGSINNENIILLIGNFSLRKPRRENC